MFKKIKKNRNVIGLMGTCLINNILYMFLNTFMVAYFITLTKYDYKLISIYYILTFIGILFTFLILGKTVKNKNQIGIFRSGIILYCIYILIISLLKEKIVTYYAFLGLFYGFVQGLFWVAGHTLINEYTKDIENSFISFKSILSKILKIFFPFIFGLSIELTSFSEVSKIVILLSLAQISFSFMIKDKEKIHIKKYNLIDYLKYIKNKKNFKTTYKIAACDGIVHYLLETIITILIVMTFKTTLSLGIITTICSICSILSVYIFQYKLKSNKIILKISSIMMIMSVILLLLDINKLTIIIYNLCNSVFLVLLMNTAETKNYDIINEDKKVMDDYIVEHQVTWQIVLNVSRILGYIILFLVSLFNNMLIFKILLVIVSIIIIIYTNLMINLSEQRIKLEKMDCKLNEQLQLELHKNNYSFKKASISDLENILNIYEERMNWFKEKGIKQWSKYLEHHPREEFIDVINSGHFFVIKEHDNIIGGFELSTNSKYWQDDLTNAYYIYKLVTRVNYKNVGNIIIKICKNIAINNKKSKLRLDCLRNNERLNNIYDNYGFKLIKTGYEDSYSYSLREYNIN